MLKDVFLKERFLLFSEKYVTNIFHEMLRLFMIVNLICCSDVRKLGRDFKEFPSQKVVENNCLDCGPYANQVLKRSCRWSLERLTAYLVITLHFILRYRKSTSKLKLYFCILS